MDAKKMAQDLLTALGGKENIKYNAVCMTRLRVILVNPVNLENVKKIEGVLGINEVDTIQIILGPGKVNKVGLEFSNLTGIALNDVDVKDIARENKKNMDKKYQGSVQLFLQKIANIFVPLLPGIVAAGLILGITNVVNVTTKGAFNAYWWYQLIRTGGWAMFAYLAIYVGANASKEFGGSAVLGGILGSLFVANSSMPLLIKIGDKPLNLPITNQPFSPGLGGLLAALFMGVIVAHIEKFFRRTLPSVLNTFLTPLFTVIISLFIAVIIIQPVGTYVTTGIFIVLSFLYEKLGFVGGYILSAGFLPLVAVGLHRALTPIHVLLNSPDGPTNGINYLLPILMMAGGGQVGAGFALYFKTKNKKLKQLVRDSIPVGILGIGEPLMYAVTLPLGKPFVTACIGAGFGGMLATIFHLGAITQGVSGLFGLLIVVPGTWIYYLIAMFGAYIGGFVITWLFGIDEDRIDEVYGE